MASIFHYTGASGLLGIIESDSLFATDYRYLNDSSEGTVVKDLLLPIFEAEIAEITPKLIEKGWLNKEFYDDYGIGGHRMQAEAMYRSLSKATDNVSPFFVLSFCRHDEGSSAFEHGLLSQWRGYAQGSGFAIEFDEEGLDALMFAEQKKYCYAAFKSDDVQYEDFQQSFDAKDFKGVAGEMIYNLFNRRPGVSDVTGRADIDRATLKFATLAPFLKHKGFKEEDEYRMVGVCVRKPKIPKEDLRPVKPIKFRNRNNLLVPYIELFGEDQKLPIKSVIIGPSQFQQMQAEAVAMVAEAKGRSIPIRISDIPFRY
jgi:hypothetical protein